MAFVYSRYGLRGREGCLERALEILPGALSWSLLLGMIFLSVWKPFHAAALVIAFFLYWLLRLFYLTLFLVLSYLRLSLEQDTDWMERVRRLESALHGAAEPNEESRSCLPSTQAVRGAEDHAAQGDSSPATAGKEQVVPHTRVGYGASTESSTEPQSGGKRPKGMRDRFSEWIHSRKEQALRRSGSLVPCAESICHVVIVPIANERRAVYEPGIQRLASQKFPASRLLVALAVEDRAGEKIKKEALQAQARYRKHFLDLLVVVHPDGLPGEARVKGANVTFAAKAARAWLVEQGLPLSHATVSCFDADTIVSPHYFSCLTYQFMICPWRARASFQPIPVYHNNIWDVPGFARVLDVGASFFQMIEATNPEKLVTFSSHSMSFQALFDVGYWPVDIISDDSAIFWKAFLHFEGDYRAVPMSVTVSMDVAAGRTWWKTAANVYRQKRRWAWGIENFPILLRGFARSRRIRFFDKVRYGFKMLESHVSWATWPFLLTAIGWLPGVFATREFATSVMYHMAPRIAQTVFHLASGALVTTVILSWLLLPQPSAPRPLLKRLLHVFEWLFIPVIAVWLSAVPALEAQTRLLLGRYMEFWVTEKPKRRR